MLSPDDFTYALENTRVLLAPTKRLDTFGTSLFNYFLVTEEMDAVNLSRVREGHIHAERPQIVTPQNIAGLFLEGFGDQGQKFGRPFLRCPRVAGKCGRQTQGRTRTQE
jgi:hypothetical protein